MTRLCLFFHFDDEAAAKAALPHCLKTDDQGNTFFDPDCIDGGCPVPDGRPDGYYLNYLYEPKEDDGSANDDVSVYEAIPGWIATAINGYAAWTIIRGDATFVPARKFA